MKVNGGNGCIETRSIRVTDEIALLKGRHDWVGSKSIIAVIATRELDNKVTKETRYFISNLNANNLLNMDHDVCCQIWRPSS